MPTTPGTIDDSQFELTVRSLADTLSLGNDPSPFRGSGGTFVQSRPYQAGDAVRSIDWRVTARTGRPHVKEYESLRHKPVVLVVDQSCSMFVRSIDRSKWQWAVALAGALGLAALRRSSAVGLFGTGLQRPALRSPPSLSRDAVLQWTAKLRQSTFVASCSLADTLRELDAVTREKSLIVVLTDAHESAAVDALKRLAARHEVVVLRLQDPAEIAAPPRGYFRGREAENETTFLAGTGTPFANPDPAAVLRRADVGVITLRTDTDFVPALRDFLATRGRPA